MPMLPSAGKLFWISFSFVLICTVLRFPVEIQAQEFQYSSDPNDYDFGWLANGIHAPGSVPTCSYCVNAIYNASTGSEFEGLNRTVAMYRCDGVQTNERWAYHNLTNAIVFSNLTTVLCIDVVTSNSTYVLKVLPCNSSALTQRWTLHDNRVTSGLVGSNGEPMFLVASIPDKTTNPSNQLYDYPLNMASSVPPASSGYTYTDNFTFLPQRTSVDTSTNRFTNEGLLQISNSSLDHIVNGGFESSTIQAGLDLTSSNWVQVVPSYFSLCGWVTDYGPIDYVKSGLVPAAEGVSSIHLNTYTNEAHWGSISQTSQTEAGKEYNLSFEIRAFPPTLVNIQVRPAGWNCSATYKEARLQLRVTNSTTDRNSTADDGGSSSVDDGGGFTTNFTVAAMGEQLWHPKWVMFKALTNVTTISFISLNFNDSCGPMIDGVKVSPPPSPGSGKRNITGVLVGSIGGAVVLLAFVAGVLCFVYRRRYCGSEEDYSGLYKTEHARVFTEREISFATKKYSSVLGSGAFGTVYKAEFPDGTVGAVKVEKPKGLKSSKVLASEEIAVLLRVHHRNLVNLTGFCIHKGRHMLVFEYLPNGSLYDRLHESVLVSPSRQSVDEVELNQYYDKVLSWQKRVKIASDVAYGIEYLHHDADPPIVHRDVKSQNILLTAMDSAKLADFGLSKAAPADATTFESIETMVRGSIGYLDPQYFQTGVFSTKSDVYSYGVVLLELISGHQAIYNATSLASWAAPYMANPSLYNELVDKKLNGKFETSELQSLVELSRMCMQEDGRMRPNMRQVVAFLNSKQLGVVGGESSEKVEESISREAYHKMHPFSDLESMAKGSGNIEKSFDMSTPKPRD